MGTQYLNGGCSRYTCTFPNWETPGSARIKAPWGLKPSIYPKFAIFGTLLMHFLGTSIYFFGCQPWFYDYLNQNNAKLRKKLIFIKFEIVIQWDLCADIPCILWRECRAKTKMAVPSSLPTWEKVIYIAAWSLLISYATYSATLTVNNTG